MRKKILFILILLFSSLLILGQKKHKEKYYQNLFAKSENMIFKGECETIKYNDKKYYYIFNDYNLINVCYPENITIDRLRLLLSYSRIIDKEAGILLIINNKTVDGELVINLMDSIIEAELPITVWVVFWEDNSWGKVDIGENSNYNY